MTINISLNRKKQQGHILAISFFVALFAMLSITAFSMNTALVAQEKLKLDQAIEATALAVGLAGDQLQSNDYQAIADTYRNAFFTPEQRQRTSIKVTPPTTSGGSYTVGGELETRFIFSKSLQGNATRIAVESDVQVLKERERLEVALVLDVSGSMASRLGALKISAKNFVSTLFNSQIDSEQVYISLVPFDDKVNIGNNRSGWTTGGHCVSAYRFNNNQAAQHILDLPVGGNTLFKGSRDCNASRLLPLSNNETTINNSLDALVYSGYTEIDNGLAWAWRTLTPQWQGQWQEIPGNRPLQEKVKKVIVLFTDGRGYADEGVFNQMCQQLRTQTPAIELFAIQYGLENAVLKNCAADLQHYYLAADTQTLQQAFQDIADKVGFTLKLKRL